MTTQIKSAESLQPASDDPLGRTEFAASRLSTAHCVVAFFAVVAAIAAIGEWPTIRAGGRPLEVDGAAHCVAWAALTYLLVASLAELRASIQRRRHGLPSAGPCWLRLSAHALVLIAAIVSIGRGLDSLALLAGLDIILPALVTVSLLTLVVGYLQHRTARNVSAMESRTGEPASPAESFVWICCQWAAALFFVITLIHLELQPPPHSRPASLVQSGAADTALNAAETALCRDTADSVRRRLQTSGPTRPAI